MSKFFIIICLYFLTAPFSCGIPRPDFEELPFVTDAGEVQETGDAVSDAKDVPKDSDIKDSMQDADISMDSDSPGEVDPACKANCYGKVCGPDGCGGFCGTCPAGTNCSFDMSKCVSEKVQMQTGAACGITTVCAPEIPDPYYKGVMIANPDWPACAHDQCLKGKCLVPYCSKDCKISKDEVDNYAKTAGSDGIEDQDSPSSGCAEVSPKSIAGKKFSCVSASSQEFEGKSGNCLPGKDFKPCVSSGDCPGGESCQIIPVKGEYQARCLTKIEDSVEVSERCNYDPYNGEIKYCSSNICHPDWGCLATCGEDGDCGAWECKSSQMPLRYENPFVFSLCVPGVCVEDSGCPDSFFCQKFLNNAAPPSEFGWENRCVKKVAGGALKGGKCNEDKTDLIPDVVCENEGWCVKGFCSSLCDSDGDCVVDAGQICAVEETAYDLNGDSILDTVLDSGYCLTIDGTNLECALETDCLYTGETCAWHEYKKEGEFFISTGCSAKDPDKGGYGEMCGGKSGIVCNNGLCLNEDKKNGIEGFCSGLCVSRNDCEKMTIGTSEYDAFCSSVFYSWGGDIDGIDDLYVPLCFPDLFGSSLLGCYGSLECADDGEVCAPHIIAMNPDSPALVEFLCRKNLTPDGKPPVLKYFDPCGSSKGELGSCEGGLCVKDAFGESYCSKLCAEDGDCVGFPSGVSCSSVTRLDRSNNQFDLILKYCVKKY